MTRVLFHVQDADLFVEPISCGVKGEDSNWTWKDMTVGKRLKKKEKIKNMIGTMTGDDYYTGYIL